MNPRLLLPALSLILVTGCSIPSFLVTPVSHPTALEEEVVQPGRGFRSGKIAIVEVEGMLLNARSEGLLGSHENPVSIFVQQLDQAEADASVKAVILRINSPGGTVSASDVMYQRVLQFKTRSRKPVIASAQDVAASGSYYISCAADEIIVQPTSIVGSIGVIFNTFDLSGTLNKIGAKTEAIKSGPLKDMGSLFRPLEQPERQVMQQIVNEFFDRFRTIVRTHRKLDDARLDAVTDGRVFTGHQAVLAGLADRTGLLEDAIAAAKELAKDPNAKVIIYKRPHGYGGSIYASGSTPAPAGSVLQLKLPPSTATLPTGFYYLWEPGY